MEQGTYLPISEDTSMGHGSDKLVYTGMLGLAMLNRTGGALHGWHKKGSFEQLPTRNCKRSNQIIMARHIAVV
jgi:hypothetical protein